MNLSPLQKARYEYSPKLPGMLRNGISDICVKEGSATASVADQDKIKALFPNTYGKSEITFEKGANTSATKKQVVGVILSGGQAPGGHNVISGLYDALKATNKRIKAMLLIPLSMKLSGTLERAITRIRKSAAVSVVATLLKRNREIMKTKVPVIFVRGSSACIFDSVL